MFEEGDLTGVRHGVLVDRWRDQRDVAPADGATARIERRIGDRRIDAVEVENFRSNRMLFQVDRRDDDVDLLDRLALEGDRRRRVRHRDDVGGVHRVGGHRCRASVHPGLGRSSQTRRVEHEVVVLPRHVDDLDARAGRPGLVDDPVVP